jgi:excisionase family DNA binding protein
MDTKMRDAGVAGRIMARLMQAERDLAALEQQYVEECYEWATDPASSLVPPGERDLFDLRLAVDRLRIAHTVAVRIEAEGDAARRARLKSSRAAAAAQHGSAAAPLPAGLRAETGVLCAEKWAGRDTFTVPEVAEILGLSINSAYAAVAAGTIPALTFGKRRVVPRKSLEKLLGA